MGFGDNRKKIQSTGPNVGPNGRENKLRIKHSSVIKFKSGVNKGKVGEQIANSFKQATYLIFIERKCDLLGQVQVDSVASKPMKEMYVPGANFTVKDTMVVSNTDYNLGGLDKIGYTFNMKNGGSNTPSIDDYVLTGIKGDNYILCKKYNTGTVSIKNIRVIDKESGLVVVTNGVYASESAYYGKYKESTVDTIVYNKRYYNVNINDIVYIDLFLKNGMQVQVVSVSVTGDEFEVKENTGTTFTITKDDIKEYNDGFSIIREFDEEVPLKEEDFIGEATGDEEQEEQDEGDEKEVTQYNEPEEQQDNEDPDYVNSFKDNERTSYVSTLTGEQKMYKESIKRIINIIGVQLDEDIFQVMEKVDGVVKYFIANLNVSDNKYVRYIIACVMFYEYVKSGIRERRQFSLKMYTNMLANNNVYLYEKDVMSQVDDNVLLDTETNYSIIKKLIKEKNVKGLAYMMMKKCDELVQTILDLNIDSDYDDLNKTKPFVFSSGKVIDNSVKMIRPYEMVYSKGNFDKVSYKDRAGNLQINEHLSVYKNENERDAAMRSGSKIPNTFYTYRKTHDDEEFPGKKVYLSINELQKINIGEMELPQEEYPIKWDRMYKVNRLLQEMNERWSVQNIDTRVKNLIVENLYRAPYAIRDLPDGSVKNYFQNIYDELLNRFVLQGEELEIATELMNSMEKVHPISKDTYAYRREQKRREGEAAIENITKKTKTDGLSKKFDNLNLDESEMDESRNLKDQNSEILDIMTSGLSTEEQQEKLDRVIKMPKSISKKNIIKKRK
jgi:hypothetical protein